jgi:hypothetical protein
MPWAFTFRARAWSDNRVMPIRSAAVLAEELEGVVTITQFVAA